jgi:hypothetical protein
MTFQTRDWHGRRMSPPATLFSLRVTRANTLHWPLVIFFMAISPDEEGQSCFPDNYCNVYYFRA